MRKKLPTNFLFLKPCYILLKKCGSPSPSFSFSFFLFYFLFLKNILVDSYLHERGMVWRGKNSLFMCQVSSKSDKRVILFIYFLFYFIFHIPEENFNCFIFQKHLIPLAMVSPFFVYHFGLVIYENFILSYISSKNWSNSCKFNSLKH